MEFIVGIIVGAISASITWEMIWRKKIRHHALSGSLIEMTDEFYSVNREYRS